MVNDSYIKPGYRSDHSNPLIDVQFHNNKKGPGYWKLNTSLLGDIDYVNSIKSVIHNVVRDNARDADALLLWDTIKCQIRGESIRFSSLKKKKRECEIQQLYTLQEKAFAEIQKDHPDQTKVQEFQGIKSRIETLLEEKAKGNKIRCKTQWYEEGEKCTKYFLNLEKRNYNAKCITKLISHENQVVTDQNGILEEESNFYRTLYTSVKPDVYDPDIQEFLGSEIGEINSLSDEDKHNLDEQISETELLACLKSCQNGKSPGLDGIPVDFYKVFWNDIKTHFMNAVNLAFEKGLLSLSQRQGTITLLPKKGKDCLYLKNWRPISLLNADYKLISKTIALRIKSVLLKLIHSDQSGFVPGRYIGENINTMLNLLDYTEMEDIPALLVFIDFEKAFDYLEWDFIIKTLERLNFGPNLIKWVKTIYTDPSSCVHNNGWRSEFFPLSRGVRQGCPLSPYLFILCAELLATAVRRNNKVEGIKIEDHEFKLNLYADDTSLCLTANTESLKEAFGIFTRFQKFSGLKVNMDKTEVLRIGSLANSDFSLWPESNLSWTNGPVKSLGLDISPNSQDIIGNYNKIHCKMKNLYTLWLQRGLSMKGKVTIIKSLAMSQLTYAMSNLPSPPVQVLNDIQASNFKFIWNNKQDRIKRQVMFMNYTDGGCRMKDIISQEKALKLSWIKRIFEHDSQKKWKTLLEQQFKPLKYCKKYFFMCNLSKPDFGRLFGQNMYSKFWLQTLSHWCEYNFKGDMDNVEEILSQPIWYNSLIRIQNTPVFYKSWFESGIQFISDIINDDGTFLDYREFARRYGNDKNFLMYHGLVNAIPVTWKRLIRDGANVNRQHNYLIDNLIDSLSTSKMVYESICKTKIVSLDTLLAKWNNDLNENLDMSTFMVYFKKINETTTSSKLQSFQLKLLHRAHTTNIFAQKIGIYHTQLCTFCGLEPETLTHLFSDCTFSLRFWSEIKMWLEARLRENISLNRLEIMLGHDKNVINLCTIAGKSYLYLCKTNNNRPEFKNFITHLSNIEQMERNIAVKNKMVDKHNRKWYIMNPEHP